MNHLQHALDWIVKRKLSGQSPAKPQEFIYLIRCGEYHKIGITSDVKARLSMMQTGSPHKLTLTACWPVQNAKEDERQLHSMLESYHIRGEWFKLPKELVASLLKR